LLIEVSSEIQMGRMERWSRYGRSAASDTRVAACLPSGAGREAKDDEALKKLGVGLLIVGGETVLEMLTPLDLSMNVELPDLGELPKKI
jgi:hypothetical protein